MTDLNLAFVQDWLMDFGGAERCLEALCLEFPRAPIYCLFHDPAQFKTSHIADRVIHTTFLDRPFFKKRYRTFLGLYPFAIEQLDMGRPDVVLSFSHSVAHGALVPSDTLHLCYCHTPIRYVWDLTHEYLRLSRLTSGMKSWVARAILHYLRIWDTTAAGRVDAYIANSGFVARRIERTYGKTARVIYPPVEIDRFKPAAQRGENFLVVGRMVPYKRADLAVVACTRLGLPLRVIGDGPESARLMRLAGPTVEFLGRQPDGLVAEEMAKARALLFCGEEDFGITPVEAQAAGTPVIAYGRGGALETVIPPVGEDATGATGMFFKEPTADSLAQALLRHDGVAHEMKAEAAVANAARFAAARYVSEMREAIAAEWEAFRARR